jgi:hypothetical protein
MTFADWMGLLQAAATLGALYFAWRTVSDAREATRELRIERVARTLDTIADVVAELDLFARNANNYRTQREQVRLRTLLGGIELPLRRTRELADAPTGSLDDLIATHPLCDAVLEEIAETAADLRERMG